MLKLNENTLGFKGRSQMMENILTYAFLLLSTGNWQENSKFTFVSAMVKLQLANQLSNRNIFKCLFFPLQYGPKNYILNPQISV